MEKQTREAVLVFIKDAITNALYVDGKLVEDGHEIPIYTLYESIGNDLVTIKIATARDMRRGDQFPLDLEDLPLTVE